MRSLVVVEKGAKATIIETHESGDAQVNAALELVVGDEAQVDYIKITHARAVHVATLLATIGARAQFNSFAFTADAQLVRNQAFIRFAGEGTKAGIRGVSLLRGKDHVDTTLADRTRRRPLREPRTVQGGAGRPESRRVPGQDRR